MDFNRLVELIASKVAAKIEEAEAQDITCGEQPKLLFLSQEFCDCGRKLFESPKINGLYQTQCAKQSDYNCDLDDIEAVILFDLTNEALAKIAMGICDCPFTKLACKAILSGKRIFVPNCAVELYECKDCAPKCYYDMMNEKLNFLKQSGLVFCDYDVIEDIICGAASEKPCCSEPAQEGKEYVISKKVVTERDIIEANMAGCAIARVSLKAIVTELAKDAMKTRGISLVRE